MENNGSKLAQYKTAAIILRGARDREYIRIELKAPSKQLRYLGVIIDEKLE